jgi:hypothetical protein
MKTTHEQPHYEEDQFLRHLLTTYPEIWPKDSAGLPVPPRSGFDCPPGWQGIVETLCGVIHQRLTKTQRSVPNPDLRKRIMIKLYRGVILKIHYRLYCWLDPYKAYRPQENFRGAWVIPPDIYAKVQTTWKYKMQKKLCALTYSKLAPSNQFISLPALTNVTVAQVKEKFGSLRFYIDGGDEAVESFITMAEYASSRTCEVTGNAGSACVRGGWYKTLSPEQADLLGYKALGPEEE